MQLPEVGTVAFVIAVVAFFTNLFNLHKNKALALAFVVALVYGYAPIVSDLLPTVAPFITVLLETVKLFLAAAGGYDFTMTAAGRIGKALKPKEK